MLPFLMIDPKTVYWVDFPSNTKSSGYVTFNYEHRPKITLNDGLKFDDGVVTGKIIQIIFIKFS